VEFFRGTFFLTIAFVKGAVRAVEQCKAYVCIHGMIAPLCLAAPSGQPPKPAGSRRRREGLTAKARAEHGILSRYARLDNHSTFSATLGQQIPRDTYIPTLGAAVSSCPSSNFLSCVVAHDLTFRRWATAVNVKLMLPPDKSRGSSGHARIWTQWVHYAIAAA
jgi:hypothetical protein